MSAKCQKRTSIFSNSQNNRLWSSAAKHSQYNHHHNSRGQTGSATSQKSLQRSRWQKQCHVRIGSEVSTLSNVIG
jgi:hypothetical protein